MTKKWMNITVLVLMVLPLVLLLQGCTNKDYAPARKAWFSVEKSPMKLIYIDDAGNLDRDIMAYMADTARKQKYHPYIFGSTETSVSIVGKGTQSDVESDTDSMSRTVDVKARVR